MLAEDPCKPIRAVFFDYDGVLTTDKTGSLTTCRYLSMQTGIAPQVFASALRPYNEDLTTGRRSHSDVWPELCETLGQPIPLELLPLAFESTPANEPMFELARELKRRYIVGIITDNKKDRIDYLRKTQRLDSLFAPIVLSAELGCTKQGPRMFEAALAQSGLRADEVVFIDNNAANLVAPRELGIHTIHFDDARNDVSSLRRRLKDSYGLDVEGDA